MSPINSSQNAYKSVQVVPAYTFQRRSANVATTTTTTTRPQHGQQDITGELWETPRKHGQIQELDGQNPFPQVLAGFRSIEASKKTANTLHPDFRGQSMANVLEFKDSSLSGGGGATSRIRCKYTEVSETSAPPHSEIRVSETPAAGVSSLCIFEPHSCVPHSSVKKTLAAITRKP